MAADDAMIPYEDEDCAETFVSAQSSSSYHEKKQDYFFTQRIIIHNILIQFILP